MIRAQSALAAYYTPPRLAEILVRWAVCSPTDRVLEPSFGGGCFLESIVARLRQLGAVVPGPSVHGVDIDPSLFNTSGREHDNAYGDCFLHNSDFLLLGRNDIDHRGFDAIIGNPPFIRNERLSATCREQYAAIARCDGYSIPGRASTWTFFVLLALKHLNAHGRIAWVLPWSLLTSAPGLYVRRVCSEYFDSVGIYPVDAPLFRRAGTSSRTVVLACSGFDPRAQQGASEDIHYVTDCAELDQVINRTSHSSSGKHKGRISATAHAYRERMSRLLHESRVLESSRTLSELGTCRIGIVTGDTSLFVLTGGQKRALGLPRRWTRRCLHRADNSVGVLISAATFRTLDQAGKRTHLLLIPPRARLDKTLLRHLHAHGPGLSTRDNTTFTKRSPWYAIGRDEIPDGFIRAFTQQGPVFLVNCARCVATNSLFSFRLRDVDEVDPLFVLNSIALSVAASPAQAVAELEGARFRSGALKLRVADVRNLPVFVPDLKWRDFTRQAIQELHDNLQRSGHEASRQVADHWLAITHGFRASERLARCVSDFRLLRTGRRTGASSDSGA